MSEIRVSSIRNEAGTGAPSFPSGVNVTGVVTATTFAGTLTSCTELPVSTGISGLAANVATILATP